MDEKINLKRITGFTSGILNGLFGAGGGIALIPLLRKCGLDEKKAHATSICVIFCLSIISVTIFTIKEGFSIYGDATKYIPGGIIGAFCGAIFLKKLSNEILRKLFAIVMIFFAVRIFVK